MSYFAGFLRAGGGDVSRASFSRTASAIQALALAAWAFASRSTAAFVSGSIRMITEILSAAMRFSILHFISLYVTYPLSVKLSRQPP